VDQYHDRKFFWVAVGGYFFFCREDLRTAAECYDRLAAIQKEVCNFLGLVYQTSRIVSQVENKRGHAIFLQFCERGANFVVAGEVESAIKIDVPDAVSGHVVIRYRIQSYAFTHKLELDRLAHAETHHLHSYRSSFRPDQLVGNLLGVPGLCRLAVYLNDLIAVPNSAFMSGGRIEPRHYVDLVITLCDG